MLQVWRGSLDVWRRFIGQQKITLIILRMAKEVKDGKVRRRRPRVARDVEYDVFGL